MPDGEREVIEACKAKAQRILDEGYEKRLSEEYDLRDPMVFRAIWAKENSARDIPTQIESWRREAAAMDPGSRVARGMHAMADQMEYLWNKWNGFVV